MSSPPRASKSSKNITKKVSPPLSNARFNRFIYTLVILSTILIGFYSYRLYQWKTDVGGWWTLLVSGRHPRIYSETTGGAAHHSQPQSTQRGDCNCEAESVEDRINALAEALGMPSRDLAVAIAGAVREYVPPASLSSIREKETGGPAVEELLKERKGGKKVENNNGASQGSGIPVVDNVVDKMETFVGMDEP